MAAEADWVMKEAAKVTVHDSLQIAPGHWWDVGDVSPSPERSGGRDMVQIELIPSPEGTCTITVPATMPLATLPVAVGK